jgi:hypothetical protein
MRPDLIEGELGRQAEMDVITSPLGVQSRIKHLVSSSYIMVPITRSIAVSKLPVMVQGATASSTS